jgi:hypothetical protein
MVRRRKMSKLELRRKIRKLRRFRSSMEKAERDIAAGRFVPLEKLQRKY